MEIEKGKGKYVLFLGRLAFSTDLTRLSNSVASWTLLPDGNAIECKTPASHQWGEFFFFFLLRLKNAPPPPIPEENSL